MINPSKSWFPGCRSIHQKQLAKDQILSPFAGEGLGFHFREKIGANRGIFLYTPTPHLPANLLSSGPVLYLLFYYLGSTVYTPSKDQPPYLYTPISSHLLKGVPLSAKSSLFHQYTNSLLEETFPQTFCSLLCNSFGYMAGSSQQKGNRSTNEYYMQAHVRNSPTGNPIK